MRAAAALKQVKGDRVIIVGCSVGGSCALELASAAPDRIAALVLIGTKAAHHPDPALHSSALDIIQKAGLEAAWSKFWAPLFSRSVSREVVSAAKQLAVRQSPLDIARGVTAFHTRPSRDQCLSTVCFPVVVVTGAEDIAPRLKVSSAQADLAPNGQLQIIPDCGHYVPLEKPESLNSILRNVIGSL